MPPCVPCDQGFSANFCYDDVVAAANGTLRRLDTDYIDLYQVNKPNNEIPLEETISAMEALVQAGKVRFIGVSNFAVDQLQRAQRALARNCIASNQVRYSMVDRTIENGLLEYCAAQRITVIAYTPLARGLHHLYDCDPRGVLGTSLRNTARRLHRLRSTGACVAIQSSSSPSQSRPCASWRIAAHRIGT